MALLGLSLTACSNDDNLDTNQYKGGVSLNVYGPSPVMRGGQLRFLGSNLDQVSEVIIPDGISVTNIQVVQAGVPSEIRVTVPKDGPVPGTTFERKDREYWVPMFVPGSAEYTNMNVELMDKHPELAMFFERMTFLPLEKITPMVPMGGSGIGMHVIPVEKAISMENETADIEHLS